MHTRTPHTSVPVALAAGIILAGMWLIALHGEAWPHDATPTAAKPQGWSYPFSCCSGYDCREVKASAIGERPEGYVIKATGEVIAYSDGRIKDSPDGAVHLVQRGWRRR